MGCSDATPGGNARISRRDVFALAASAAIGGGARAALAAGAAGQLVYGVHISLAPTWFDPAETQGIITPYMLLYALHDGRGEADARPAACTVPGAVLVGGGRRAELRASCSARKRCSTTANR